MAIVSGEQLHCNEMPNARNGKFEPGHHYRQDCLVDYFGLNSARSEQQVGDDTLARITVDETNSAQPSGRSMLDRSQNVERHVR